jgi:hypothetical protein
MPKQPIRRFKQLNKHIAKMRRFHGPSDFVLRLQEMERLRLMEAAK